MSARKNKPTQRRNTRRRKSSRTKNGSFGWKFILFLIVLCLLFYLLLYFAPQIMSHLGMRPDESRYKMEEPAGSAARTARVRPSHYKDLEIPAPFADSRPHRLRAYTAYTISYNNEWRLPNWVAYELTRDELAVRVKRTDDFRPDEKMSGRQASLADYRKSGFDRGHMAPAADMRWDATAMTESFYLTNMCPQTPALNRGDWERLEDQIRVWAERDSAIVIVCGPIVSPVDTTIGGNRVKVPSAFYKVIVAPYVDEERGIGFIFANDPERKKLPLSRYAVTIDSIETLTGIDFFHVLPDEIENRIESRYDLREWNL